MTVKVELSPNMIRWGATVGLLRHAQNIEFNRDPGSRPVELGWQNHIEGALGEIAFAKWANLFPSGAFTLNAVDVGRFEVRTRSRQGYDLIVHPKDKDDAIFILVVGIDGTYELQGWIRGADAKQQRHWNEPVKGRAAFFVRREFLNPMDTLEVKR